MKNKWICGVLAVVMALSLCACQEGTDGSSKADAAKETAELNTEENKVEENTNDLPIGYFDDNGYYNTYFGFQLQIPDGENTQMNTEADQVADFLKLSNGYDLDEKESIDKLLKERLENEGGATVYDPVAQSVTINSETFTVRIFVSKRSGDVSEEEEIANLKENMILSYQCSDEDFHIDKIEFAGKESSSMTWTGANGDNHACVFLFTEDYECTIWLEEYSSFEAAYKAFKSF